MEQTDSFLSSGPQTAEQRTRTGCSHGTASPQRDQRCPCPACLPACLSAWLPEGEFPAWLCLCVVVSGDQLSSDCND